MGTAKKYQHKGAATLQVQEFNKIADKLDALVSSCIQFISVTKLITA